jgi:[acyl-carrier-protein] S-malonyltransferase
MGYTLAARFPEFEIILEETLREADATLDFPLSSVIKNGPGEKLKETEITQPALLAVSTAMGRWLKSKGIKASLALGHSLGEYSALVHSEALSFTEAIKLVETRGRLMQNAVPLGQGGMAALIGATPEIAERLCADISKRLGAVLAPSVINNPGQVVISGESRAIAEAVKQGREFGVRMVTTLEVSGPFHCSLLKGAGEALGLALKNIKISTPTIPVYSNVTAKIQSSPEEISQNLIKQVYQTVRWEDCVRAAIADGTTRFIEVGAGKVLTGISKKIGDISCIPLETIETLESL